MSEEQGRLVSSSSGRALRFVTMILAAVTTKTVTPTAVPSTSTA